jgi:hypothetical protein
MTENLQKKKVVLKTVTEKFKVSEIFRFMRCAALYGPTKITGFSCVYKLTII